MPVALPAVAAIALAAFAGAFILVCLVYAARELLDALAEVLRRHVPLVGGALSDAIVSATNYFQARLARAARLAGGPLAAFLSGLAAIVNAVGEALIDAPFFASQALRYLREQAIPSLIRAALRPISAAIERLRAAINQVARSVGATRRLLLAAIASLRTFVMVEAVRPLRRLLVHTIPALTARVTALAAATAAFANEVVLPRLGAIDLDLSRLWERLRQVDFDLSKLREYLLPLAAVFTIAEVVALLRHVRHCRRHTEKVCGLDLDSLDDLLGAAMVGLTLSQIVQIVEASQGLAEDIGGHMLGLVEQG